MDISKITSAMEEYSIISMKSKKLEEALNQNTKLNSLIMT